MSKVLNGKSGVTPDTERTIIQGAYDMGYKKLPTELLEKINIQPPGVMMDNGMIVMLTHREDRNIFWNSIISGIYLGLEDANYSLVYCEINDSPSWKMPEILASKRAGGLIVVNVYDRDILDQIAGLEIPKVYLDSPPDYDANVLNGDILLTEGLNSIKKITRHLIKTGCKHLSFIGDISYSKTIYDRWMGFREAFIEAGMEIEQALCFTSDEDRFYSPAAISRIMDGLKSMPDAFVCANDNIALLVMKQLEDREYDVPGDVRVSGYDDDQGKNVIFPDLTSVKVCLESLGRRLVKQLIWRIEDDEQCYEAVYIFTEVIFRESTCLM